jgi:hypothetical protein
MIVVSMVILCAPAIAADDFDSQLPGTGDLASPKLTLRTDLVDDATTTGTALI